MLHSTKVGQLPPDQFFSGKIESSIEGRVHRILKQLAELQNRSVFIFGGFSSSEIGQLGEKAGVGQMSMAFGSNLVCVNMFPIKKN